MIYEINKSSFKIKKKLNFSPDNADGNVGGISYACI